MFTFAMIIFSILGKTNPLALTIVKHLSGAPFYGRFLTLTTNIRLGWKGLPGTNALAYYKNS